MQIISYPIYTLQYISDMGGVNGLQVNGGGVLYRKFTKSLIFHNFDDVLKNPFRYVDLFLLHTLL